MDHQYCIYQFMHSVVMRNRRRDKLPSKKCAGMIQLSSLHLTSGCFFQFSTVFIFHDIPVFDAASTSHEGQAEL